jgi:hypothetical protein
MSRNDVVTSDRKKLGVAFWATVVVVVVLAYPLSLGPACWLSTRVELRFEIHELLYCIYAPMIEYAVHGQNRTARAIQSWSRLDGREGMLWLWSHGGRWSSETIDLPER